VEEVERATGLVLTLAQARRVLAVNADGRAETDDFTEFFADDTDTPQCLLARALASQTFMVWSTGEHTTEPLMSFGVGPGSSALRGIYPNTHLYEVIQAALGGGVDP
jgi:alkaline phosphatase